MAQTDTSLAGLKSVNASESPPAQEKLRDAVPKPKNAAPAPATNIRYKLVKVRKADGTIVTVKRPIKQETLTTTSSSTSALATTSSSSSTSKVITTTKNTVSATTQQTSTSLAQKSDKEILATKLPAKSPNPVAAPAKIESESSSKIAEQSITASHEGSSATPADHKSSKLASTSKVSKGISRLEHGGLKLATKLFHTLDGDSDTDGGDDDDGDDDDGADDTGSDSRDSDQETDSDVDDKRGDTDKTDPLKDAGKDAGKTATKEAMRYAAKGPVISEKRLRDVKSDDSLATTLDEEEAKPLKQRYKHWSRYFIWGIMLIFPILFIFVGLLIAFIDGKPSQSKKAIAIQNALQVAVSVWPVTFAAIVAQSLRTYATYKVERGLRLMTLEQLLNGHSLASSIKQPFLFRRFNWVTLALLVLWGFSPLATQAMQRVSTSSYSNQDTTGIWGYMNTATGSNYLSLALDDFSQKQPDMTRLYSTAFLADNNTYEEDMFNNALIPILELSELSPGHNWTPIDDSSNYNYTSLYGIPVAFPDPDNATDYQSTSSEIDPTFNVMAKAGYLTFDCSEVNTTTMEDSGYMFPAEPPGGTPPTLYVAMTPMNDTTPGRMAFASLITRNTTDDDSFINIDLNNPNYTDTYAYSYCNFTQTFIDVNISCTGADCFVAAVRPSAGSHSFLYSGNQTDSAFMEAAGTTTDGVATDTERYIMNGYVIDSPTTADLTKLSHTDFTTRLSLLLNTYWQIGFGPTHFADSLQNKSSGVAMRYDQGSRIDEIPICTTSWGWFAALMVSSAFLLLASIASIIWDARSISPNVLGFASSVLKENNNIRLHDMPADMPHVRPSASVRELVRKLGNVTVVMQDVKPEDKVGRIELGADHPGVKKLEVGRGYY